MIPGPHCKGGTLPASSGVLLLPSSDISGFCADEICWRADPKTLSEIYRREIEEGKRQVLSNYDDDGDAQTGRSEHTSPQSRKTFIRVNLNDADLGITWFIQRICNDG